MLGILVAIMSFVVLTVILPINITSSKDTVDSGRANCNLIRAFVKLSRILGFARSTGTAIDAGDGVLWVHCAIYGLFCIAGFYVVLRYYFWSLDTRRKNFIAGMVSYKTSPASLLTNTTTKTTGQSVIQ